MPEDSLLRSQTSAEVLKYIDAENVNFLSSCHRPIKQYFESGRLSAVAICTSLLADVTNDGTRFNNAKQMTIWAWPGVSTAISNRMKYFAEAIGVPIEYQ